MLSVDKKILFPENIFLFLQKIFTMSFKEIIKKFNNKYLIATLIFTVIILFIDQYNVFFQIKNFKKLREAKEKVEFYEKEIQNQQGLLEELNKDSVMMERIAREKYMMKRDNEVIYIIQADEDEE